MLSIALVNMPKYLAIHAKLSTILSFLLTSLPPTLPYVIPFAFVVAALFHFSLLDSKSELVAMKSVGVSVFRISGTLFRSALLLSFFMIFVNTYLAPVFLGKSRTLRPQAIKKVKKMPEGQSSTANSNKSARVIRSAESPGVCYYYEGYRSDENKHIRLMKFVSFNFENAAAHRLLWAFVADKIELGPLGLISVNNSRRFNFSAGKLAEKATESFFVPDRTSFFSLHRPEVDEMTSYQLRQYISEQKKIGIQPYRYITTYYDRFASAFSPLILLLVGLPFIFMGKGGRRKTPAKGIATGILLVVFYYAFASLFHSFGSAHYLPPFLAAWMINILFLLGGIFLFTEVRT